MWTHAASTNTQFRCEMLRAHWNRTQIDVSSEHRRASANMPVGEQPSVTFAHSSPHSDCVVGSGTDCVVRVCRNWPLSARLFSSTPLIILGTDNHTRVHMLARHITTLFVDALRQLFKHCDFIYLCNTNVNYFYFLTPAHNQFYRTNMKF